MLAEAIGCQLRNRSRWVCRSHNSPASVHRARGHVYAHDPPLLALYQNSSLMVTINMQLLLRELLTVLLRLIRH